VKKVAQKICEHVERCFCSRECGKGQWKEGREGARAEVQLEPDST
jgi:hypothetical protein